MYRFKLNDNLKKYIKETESTKDKNSVIRYYLEELTYECDVTIFIGFSHLKFSKVIVLPDWEAKCFRIDHKKREQTFNKLNEILDLKNTFNIPFKLVLEGHVKFVSTFYGKMNLTNKFIELVENVYNDQLVGYRYEFIPEAWKDAHRIGRVYFINNKFYNVWFDEKDGELNLEDINDGQCVDVTAMELLRGKYDYIDNLSKDENGLLIPKIDQILMFETKDKKW